MQTFFAKKPEAGPCPFCGTVLDLHKEKREYTYGERDTVDTCNVWWIRCPKCLWRTGEKSSRHVGNPIDLLLESLALKFPGTFRITVNEMQANPEQVLQLRKHGIVRIVSDSSKDAYCVMQFEKL